jgi:L-threonylcarbamoyladenylate synthase
VSAEAFERCIAGGGVAVFPTDTVYGLACDVENRAAVMRLYGLKGRTAKKPSAVMFFDTDLALSALPELGPRTGAALRRLLPGGVTVLLENPRERYPLACGADSATLGLRVPIVSSLAGARCAVLQSSANFAGGPDPRLVRDVPDQIRAGADLVIDAGELPGTPSTVVDLRPYEADGSWAVVRAGAADEEKLGLALRSR